MTVRELIEAVRAAGVELWFEGERLRFRAPKGGLTVEHRAALSAHRGEVIAKLRAEAGEKEKICPLSFSQRSLWFLHQQAPESSAYHIAMPVRILSGLHIAALRQALQALVDRHAILRTTYDYEDGALCQKVAGLGKATFEEHAVKDLDDEELHRIVLADHQKPFDFAHGPLFRASLYTRAQADHVLLLTVHHVAADGWSLILMTEELFKLYNEANGGPAANLTRPELQYADYVAWQEQMLAGDEGNRLWAYWREKLAAPRTQIDLPTDYARPAVHSFRGASVPLQLGPDLTSRVKDLALRENTTPFVVLLAAFQTFLFRLTGVDDVIVGTPAFARSKPQFIQIVGDFVNPVPLRARLKPAKTFCALIADLRQTVIGALDAQEFPLSLLVQRLQPERDSGRSPLFDTFFILQRFDQFREIEELLAGDESGKVTKLAGLQLCAYPLEQQEGQFDLALQMVEHRGIFHGAFKYRTDLFQDSTIARFAKDYAALVEALVADASVPFESIPMIADKASESQSSAFALIGQLRKKDIKLYVDGDRLRVNAPQGAIDDELKTLIAARRDDLISALKMAAPADRTRAGGIRRVPREQLLPVSSAQKRLWFLDQMEPGLSHYNIGGAVRFRGLLDAENLRQALNGLVVRHESLRMRLAERDGGPWLEISETGMAAVDTANLSQSSNDKCTAEALRLADVFLNKPFDMARGPLARFLIIRLAPDDHMLAVSMHHVVSDGWSLAIAFREICALYEERAGGRDANLQPLEVQYVDYAAWETAQLGAGRVAEHLDYWKRRLQGAPALLELPTDRPRPAAQSYRGGRVWCDVEGGLMESLMARGKDHTATLYMVLFAAWQVLMHRYSGQDDIVVGTPFANRDLPAFEGLIGCTVNNIALRTELSGNPRFADVLAEVKRETLKAFDHSSLPFDVLVERLNPERSASHAPIFQVLFTLMSFPMQVAAPSGLSVELIETGSKSSRFDLTIEISPVALGEKKGMYRALYEYATDLFDEQTILRLHAHYGRILAAVAADPSFRIQDLPLITSDEKQLLLKSWNGTSVEHDHTLCVHEVLEAAARAMPDAPAVTAGEITLSYRELDQRANQLAHLLREKGVGPGALVAICLDRTADMPVALAAVLKAGAAYVPLDPAHPIERIRHIIEDAGIACAITLRQFASLLSDTGAPLILLDEAQPDLTAQSAAPPKVAISAEDLAYVIYTSGSTGRPKGVEVEHRNLVSFLEAMRREPGLAATDVLLAVTTLSFDISGLEMWLPLSTGARVIIASRADVLDGEQLAQLIEIHGVTVFQATPATWRLLLETGWAGKRNLKALCGGEALQQDLAASLSQRVGELWNMYGPTETTVWSTASCINGSERVSIGRPIANTRVYVLDTKGQPVPIGVAGELCIGGEGVARGYRNLPELTLERFVSITLPGGQMERVYRTGDVARYHADGQLEYLGRRDHQVKVRGYRIELGEIETMLANCQGVKECVVYAREDVPGDQRLIGYVTLSGGSSFDADSARAYLRTKLPEYMIPNAFTVLAELPLTPNGKVDRKALPAASAPPASQHAVPADVLMSPAQRRVAEIWRDVLRLERVGLHDNFFDLGGHSLLLVKLHAGLKREFSSDISLVELFQRTTIASQSDRLLSAPAANDAIERARARAARQAHG